MSDPDIPRTYDSGPSDPVCMADGPGTWAEVDIDAPAALVWDLVTDVDLPSRYSDELLGATWDGDGPALGATFTGRNTHPAVGEWEITLHVHAFEPERSFGWCTADPANPGARWRFDLEPFGDRTRLRFSVALGPGPSGTTAAIRAQPDKEDRIIARRLREIHRNITRTVEGIQVVAEGAAA